jgi:hypothetical protein
MSKLKSLSHCAAPGHQPAFPRHAQMRHRPTGPPQHIQETGQVTQTTVGALLYLAIATRPDILYVVRVLLRLSKNPGPCHWTAVKHLFCYLKGTLDYKLLTFGPNGSGDPFTALWMQTMAETRITAG